MVFGPLQLSCIKGFTIAVDHLNYPLERYVVNNTDLPRHEATRFDVAPITEGFRVTWSDCLLGTRLVIVLRGANANSLGLRTLNVSFSHPLGNETVGWVFVTCWYIMICSSRMRRSCLGAKPKAAQMLPLRRLGG